LVNLVWHLMLLNGNSLQENGTILDSILTLPFVRETLKWVSFWFKSLLKMESLENIDAVCYAEKSGDSENAPVV